VLVYGSFAGGEEAGRSDVDLLVVGDVTEEEVITVVGRVEKDVGREISYVLWSEGESFYACCYNYLCSFSFRTQV
jgi:predicted nucleotidyltransferase